METFLNQESISKLLLVTQGFFMLYLIGYASFLFLGVVIGGNELFENIKRNKLRNRIKHDYYIPISIIVPAYCEEVTIRETIKSLLNLDYKLYEIIVVNDGSKDGTAERVIKDFNLHEVNKPIRLRIKCKPYESVYENSIEEKVRITLVNKENGGKADSINMGINASRYPYFICMDADSVLEKDALEKIVTPVLEDNKVVAVGGMIRISNDSIFKDGCLVEQKLPKKLLPAIQVLEYERSFLASRILLDKFNANMIISGAFGLFKKDVVIAVGGYCSSTMGEDMEVIVKLHSYHRSNNLPYKIRYAYEAVCWTQAPEQLKDLVKQRKRWHIGLLQSLVIHRDLKWSFSYIYYLIYELLSPFIEITGVIVMLLAVVVDIVDFEVMLSFISLYALFGVVLTLVSFLTRNYSSSAKISGKDVIRAILLCIPETLYIHIVLLWTRIFALVFYKRNQSWGKIKRVSIDYREEQ